MIYKILFVGAGGFIGSVLRYVLSGLVNRLEMAGSFPLGTLVVNVAGCLVIGFLYGVAESRDMIGANMRLFALVGLLGGFTTFSTFGYESYSLARDALRLAAVANVALHITLGLLAVWLGSVLSKYC